MFLALKVSLFLLVAFYATLIIFLILGIVQMSLKRQLSGNREEHTLVR